MPQNGDVNTAFGVYKSVCCGAEIVVAAGISFPDCPNHLKLPTEWKSLADEKIRHVSELFPNPKNDTSAA
jgi:hypothetical protein